MNSQPSSAIENGLTAQLMNRVTPMPRQCSRTCAERGEIDLHQHRDDHQPDQHRHRQIDLGDFGRADDVEDAGEEMAKRHAGDDAQSDPQGQVAFEHGHGWSGAGARCFQGARASRLRLPSGRCR